METSDAGCVCCTCASEGFCSATREGRFTPSLEVARYLSFPPPFSTSFCPGGHVTHNWLCVATLCRRAIQLDSSYESHVAAAASFQTSAMGVALTRTADPSASSFRRLVCKLVCK